MFTYHGVTFSAEEILKYLRKSRSDDVLLTVEEVLARHEKILDEWAERNIGEPIPECNTFREIVSGETISDRPEIQKILRMIEQPQYKAIVCVEVQRLSRGDLEDAGRLIKLLRYTNTFVITPQKAYDLNDEFDREMFERELKRGNEFLEYTKKIMQRGIIESVKDGNYVGSVAPYGYDKIFVTEGKKKVPTLQINEQEAEAVRMIFDMYVNEDMGMNNIARRLNDLCIPTRTGKLWQSYTIKDMLENVHYIGKVRRNWRKTITVVEDGEFVRMRPKSSPDNHLVFEGKHEAIISEELFKQARAKQGRNHKSKATTKVRNPLASLVYCQCGRAMSLRTYKENGKERSAPRLLCDNQAYCHTSSVTYDEVLEEVIKVLQNCIADFEIKLNADNRNNIEAHNNIVKRLEAKLQELKKKELSQWEKYAEEGMPKHVFDKLNEKVLREQEDVKNALLTAKETAPTVEDYEEKLCRFTDALEMLKNPDASAQDKNRLLKACIERIEYSRGKSNRWHQEPFTLDIKLKV